MTFDPGNRLICALDVADREAADALVARLDGGASWLKIGLELFIACGPSIVTDLAARGYRLMLDLKLHDIPATVASATARAAGLGAGLLTIHSCGGEKMMAAAVKAARAAANDSQPRTRILAVTVLTSLDQKDLAAVGTLEAVEDLVLRRAALAHEAGCDGVVASPLEASSLRRALPDNFLIVTPGVRPAAKVDFDDQQRVTSPRQARAAGADLIVVGRPIRNAADPGLAARQIAAELADSEH